jgi:hypothetical protein
MALGGTRLSDLVQHRNARHRKTTRDGGRLRRGGHRRAATRSCCAEVGCRPDGPECGGAEADGRPCAECAARRAEPPLRRLRKAESAPLGTHQRSEADKTPIMCNGCACAAPAAAERRGAQARCGAGVHAARAASVAALERPRGLQAGLGRRGAPPRAPRRARRDRRRCPGAQPRLRRASSRQRRDGGRPGTPVFLGTRTAHGGAAVCRAKGKRLCRLTPPLLRLRSRT